MALASGRAGAAAVDTELDNHDPLLWMQEYAFATRHTELVDVFFQKLAPHRDGSQVDEDSVLVARTNFYLFWKGTLEATTFDDYINQVQELMSGNLPLDGCPSLFDLKYLDTLIRCQALATLLRDENVSATFYLQQLDALFPAGAVVDSLPMMAQQMVKLVRDEFFELTVGLPKGAKAAGKELHKRGKAICERRSPEWFADRFKAALQQVETSCLGKPFLRQLAINIMEKRDPMQGIRDPLSVNFGQSSGSSSSGSSGSGEAAGSSSSNAEGSSSSQALQPVVVDSAENNAAEVVEESTTYGSSKRVSLAALERAAGNEWDAIVQRTHPEVRKFLDSQGVAAAAEASSDSSAQRAPAPVEQGAESAENFAGGDERPDAEEGATDVEEEDEVVAAAATQQDSGKASSSAATVRAELRSARQAVDKAGGEDPLAQALQQTARDDSAAAAVVRAPRIREEGVEDPNATVLTWDESQSGATPAPQGRETPIEDRPLRRVSPSSVPRRAKKRLSEITGATAGDVGSASKKSRRSRKKVPNYGDSTPKRVPFTPTECKYLIAGVEKFGKGNWKKILDSYDFHPRRTNVNLKDKWRNMERNEEV